MVQKRGLKLVVFLVFSLLYMASSIFASVEYQMIYLEVNCDTDEFCGTPTIDKYCSGICGKGECNDEDDWEEVPDKFEHEQKGCYYGLKNSDPSPSACGWTISSSGYVVNDVAKTIDHPFNDVKLYCGDGDQEHGWYCSDDGDFIKHAFNTKFTFFNKNSVVCNGEDNLWHQCDSENEGEMIDIIKTGEEEPTKYICLSNEKGNIWYEFDNIPLDLDRDGDQVPNSIDCDPNDGNTHGCV